MYQLLILPAFIVVGHGVLLRTLIPLIYNTSSPFHLIA